MHAWIMSPVVLKLATADARSRANHSPKTKKHLRPMPKCFWGCIKDWWVMQGLNLRPLPCEGSALPLS